MEPDLKLKIAWMDPAPPARLSGPFHKYTQTLLGTSRLHPGIIVIKCRYASNQAGRGGTTGWGCLRVENVPLMQLEELAQNFLVLAEARYGQ